MVIVHSTFLGGFSTGAFLGRKMEKAEAEVGALGSTGKHHVLFGSCGEIGSRFKRKIH